MSISSAIKTVFGNWKPTRLFFKKLALAVFLTWYVFHPGYIGFNGSYIRIHFLHNRPDSTILVLDATTKQPIVGAYVNVSWYDEIGTFGGEVSAELETRELLTDAKGQFRPYRWKERGDMLIVDVWKPGYTLRKILIGENDFDVKSIPSPLTLELWTSVENALQDRGASGGTYSTMEQLQGRYRHALLELKKKGINDISQLTLNGDRK